MSLESVREYFKEKGLDFEIFEFEDSTENVELAARTLGVEPCLIAKTIALKLKGRNILVVSSGDARLDNRKYKNQFGQKIKMMSPDEVMELTGHPVGGVCPFGLKNTMDVYLDVSLKQFETVYPAAGSKNSCVKMTIEQLETITGTEWVDVCS
ncbi:MAG: YbaK/EbsC family protein [Acetivibrionales bacterium]